MSLMYFWCTSNVCSNLYLYHPKFFLHQIQVPVPKLFQVPIHQASSDGSVFIDSRSGSSLLGWIPIRIQGFDDRNLKKVNNWKKLNIFWSKIAIHLSLGIYKGRPSYRRSLQSSKENIQHFKIWNFITFFYFCGSFLPSWIRIRNPLTWLNPDPIRIRIWNTHEMSSLFFFFVRSFWPAWIPRPNWIRI